MLKQIIIKLSKLRQDEFLKATREEHVWGPHKVIIRLLSRNDEGLKGEAQIVKVLRENTLPAKYSTQGNGPSDEKQKQDLCRQAKYETVYHHWRSFTKILKKMLQAKTKGDSNRETYKSINLTRKEEGKCKLTFIAL